MTELAARRVAVRRLDEALAGEAIAAPALLKIDVQGFEYEVIQGIGALVEAIEWIYAEVSLIELYEGQKLFDEIAALLAAMGYGSAGLFNEFHRDGKLVQADALFCRRAGTSGSRPGIANHHRQSEGI